MDTSNLFDYENDFKESHVKNLKRPALVTIKKPLIPNQEAEDILIRLLNLHVPAVLDEMASKGGIGRRAFLVDNNHFIQRSAASKENSSFVQRGIFELNHKQNLYIASAIPTSSSSQLSFWLSPDSLRLYDRQGEDLNSFSYSKDDEASSNADYRKTHMYQPGDPGYVIASTTYDEKTATITNARNAYVFKSFNPKLKVTGWDGNTYVPNDAKESAAIVKFDLFLLNYSDHTRLAPNDKGFATLSAIQRNASLFADNGIPQYLGYNVIYDPEDKKGLTHIMDSDAAKRAFGYLPKTKKSAYHWQFYCPTSTRVDVLSDTHVSQNKNILFNKLVALNKSVFNTYDGNKDDYTIQSFSRIIYLFDSNDYKGKQVEQAQELYIRQLKELLPEFKAKTAGYKKTVQNLATASAAAMAVTSIGLAGASFLTSNALLKKNSLSVGEIIEQNINQYEKEINNIKESENYITFLRYFDAAYKSEMEEAKQAAAARKYIRPKYDCDIKFYQFQIEYFAILLKRIEKKYNKLRYFIEDTKLVSLANENTFKSLLKHVQTISTTKNVTLSTLLAESYTVRQFLEDAHNFIYNPFGGFYITSYAPTLNETKSPYVNSVATADIFSAQSGGLQFDVANTLKRDKDTSVYKLGDYAFTILDNQNKDVSSINIDRVTNGMSTATITLKNNKEKYNYKQSDILNRTSFIIEPMDEVAVYLPTLETYKQNGVETNDGRLEPVFYGVISSVTANNNAGYHAISIKADCQKKYLTINRTNTKPSATRDESGGKMVQAFEMPYEFYGTIEKWMSYMFATSLTNLGTQLKLTDLEKGLFSIDKNKEAITQKSYDQYVIKHGTVNIAEVTEKQLTHTTIVDRYNDLTKYEDPVKYLSMSTANSGIADFTNTGVSKESVSLTNSVIPVPGSKIVETKQTLYYKHDPDKIGNTARSVTVAYRTRTTFADPLLTYLWYKTNSVNYPKEEQLQIETNLKAVLHDYVYTVIPDPEKLSFKYVKGCEQYKDYLAQGKRVAYYIYKTRTDLQYQTLSEVKSEKTITTKSTQLESTTPRRICVAKIVGTAQPAYTLKTSNFDIQFSSWKTNNDIISDIAKKFNFIYYTNRDGTILFTPYNFDLTLLNTSANTKNIDTTKMFLYRSKRDVQADDNPLILKDQYLVSYTNTDNDREIVNWLTLNGSWVINDSTLDQFTKAIVKDPVLLNKYGYRTGKHVSILGIQDEQALQLYGLAWLDRANKKYRSATATVLFDSRMDINAPYYVPTDEAIYYCEGIRIRYDAGSTCTAALNLSYGKKPLIALEPFVEREPSYSTNIDGDYALSYANKKDNDGNTFEAKLNSLFEQDNLIKPSTYVQYKNLLDPKAATVSVPSTGIGVLNADKIRNYLTEKATQIANLQIKAPTGLSVLKNVDQDAVKMAVNASICCYNGILWDNVAGIAFEELLFNYGWISAGFGTGVASAIGSNGNLMESLQKYIQTNSVDLSVTDRVKYILQTYFVHVPSIGKAKTPPQLETPKLIYADLAVPGIVDVDTLASKHANK